MNDLIFDVGLHIGDDAAYYLHLGKRVIGIEANPLLVAQCSQRFKNEIREGEMTIVNAGILKEAGDFTFYRNLHNPGWSSFEERGKKGGKWDAVKISCVTTQHLIAKYGQPFFMKVDIEGADIQALSSLTPLTAPAYVSLELNNVDPIVEKLIELGYTDFKFVDAETFWPTTPIFNRQISWRLLRKAGRAVPFVRKAIRSLPPSLRAKSEWNPPGRFSPDGYPFTCCSSGPFGELAAGSWLTPSEALRWFENLKKAYDAGHQSLWWDVHGRHSSAATLVTPPTLLRARPPAQVPFSRELRTRRSQR